MGLMNSDQFSLLPRTVFLGLLAMLVFASFASVDADISESVNGSVGISERSSTPQQLSTSTPSTSASPSSSLSVLPALSHPTPENGITDGSKPNLSSDPELGNEGNKVRHAHRSFQRKTSHDLDQALQQSDSDSPPPSVTMRIIPQRRPTKGPPASDLDGVKNLAQEAPAVTPDISAVTVTAQPPKTQPTQKPKNLLPPGMPPPATFPAWGWGYKPDNGFPADFLKFGTENFTSTIEYGNSYPAARASSAPQLSDSDVTLQEQIYILSGVFGFVGLIQFIISISLAVSLSKIMSALNMTGILQRKYPTATASGMSFLIILLVFYLLKELSSKLRRLTDSAKPGFGTLNRGYLRSEMEMGEFGNSPMDELSARYDQQGPVGNMPGASLGMQGMDYNGYGSPASVPKPAIGQRPSGFPRPHWVGDRGARNYS